MHWFMKGFLSCLTSTLLIFYKGFTFSKLWLWFVVPTFALPTLTIIQAIGIYYIICLLTFKSIYKPSNDSIFVAYAMGASVTSGCLLFGYIFSFFV